MIKKTYKCGLLEYDPIKELAVYNGKIASFKEGDRETIVLELLIKNKNHKVGYKKLIKHSISNPVKLLMLSVAWEKEKHSLRQAIKAIKNKLELPQGMIRNISNKSYKMVDKRENTFK